MLKQRKNSKFKQKKNFSLNRTKKIRAAHQRYRSLIRSAHPLNPYFRSIIGGRLKKFNKCVSIKIKPNNVFCSLTDILNKKSVYNTSSGKAGVKTSKKLLKFSSKIIIQSFFNKVKKKIKNENVLINFEGPKRLKRLVLQLLKKNIKCKRLLVAIEGKKCFNGCRAPKKRRKKRKGFRVFK